MTRAERIKRFAATVQNDIVSCPNEQSTDEGDLIWITGCPSDVPDLLFSHDVPEELQDEVVGLLKCPKCGSPLELWQEVGTKHDFESAHEATISTAMQKHGKQLFDFYGFLHKFPMLGSTHPFGRRILQEIRKSSRVAVTRSEWYRAREDKEHGFGPAPAEKVGDQRYNTSGQPRWYFADSPEAGVAEVSTKGTAWVQKFDVGQLDGLLDLRAWRADDDRALDREGDYNPPHGLLVVSLVYGDLLTQRHYSDEAGRQWKPEYLVSRFVAEAAAAAGFTGILCQSVRYPGENLIAFDPAWSPKTLGEPQSVSLDSDALRLRENYFFNEGQALIIPDLPPIGPI